MAILDNLNQVSDIKYWETSFCKTATYQSSLHTYIHNLYLTWVETLSWSYFAGFPQNNIKKERNMYSEHKNVRI